MRLILAICLLAISLSTLARNVIINDAFTGVELGAGLRYALSESDSDQPPEKSASVWKTADATLTFGFEPRPLWVNFSITNRQSDTSHLVLDIEYPLLDLVEIWISSDGQPKEYFVLGDTVPQSHNTIDHPHLLASINAPSDTTLDVFMKVQTEATLNVPMSLQTKDAFIEDTQKNIAYYIFLYGILIGIAFYHLVLYLQVREPGFLWFSLFLLTLVSIFSYFQGFFTAYVIPEYRQYSNHLLVWGYALTASFCGLYILRVLNVRKFRPLHARAVDLMILTGGVLIVASLYLSYSVMIRILTLYAVFSVIVVVSCQVRRALDLYEPAYYALLAGAFCAAGMVVTIMEKTGMVTSTMLTRSAGDLGFTLMAIMYALSLSQRMKWEQRQRRLAQADTLRTQGELLQTQEKLNKELDTLVRERTAALEEANDKLKLMSITDPLTGLYNRRHFDDQFYACFNHAVKASGRIAVLLLDIDHFKRINDEFGHPFGDACLVETARRLRVSLPDTQNTIARYGGEEFIIIMPGATQGEANAAAAKVLEQLSKEPVRYSGKSVRVTASIGVISEHPTMTGQADILLKKVDDLLYHAKHNGRNRAVAPDDVQVLNQG